MNIYAKCMHCSKELEAKTSRGLAYHINFHHGISQEDYYLKYIDSRNTCKSCNVSLKFNGLKKGYSDHCSSCATKLSWVNSDERRKELSERFKENNPGTGRPKGSKNKNPYPESGKIKNFGPEWKENRARINKCQKKIANQKKTWENKSDEEIKDMLVKQSKTRIENGIDMGKTYSGRFKPTNKEKYIGDVDNIVYRSGWELQVMRWCDNTPTVKKWSSEEVIIPYFYDVDKRYHRYHIDFLIQFESKTVLVEIKPKKETTPPEYKGRKTKRYISEGLTYVKNMNKWKAAEEYAKDRGWSFEIWTEDTLKGMGLLKPQLKGLKPLKPVKRAKKK